MIPSVVARQVRETVLDYLRTTFSLADSEFEREFFDFLDSDEGLFKGGYLDVRLPFRKVEAGARLPLDVRPPFEPFNHQLRAFLRLYSKDGHQPQHTLVTTGTGSGKTECFLYPILDHCWRNRERTGIKAIILYPMVALATDQARRIAATLADDPRLKGQVTAGLYVGGTGSHGVADRDHLVDKREILRESPPDILLTDYRMLDFLLLRPDDARLWRHNGPDTLQYLVLDELHTYDGAQGSDVACLIRRLKKRLDAKAGSLCCVGTSATVGGKVRGAAARSLTDFASKVFDEDFFEDSVITEERLDVIETLGDEIEFRRFPGPEDVEDLAPEWASDAETWIRRQADIWLGPGAGRLTPAEIGVQLCRHDFLRQLLKVLDGQLKSFAQCSDELEKRLPEWADLDSKVRRRVLESFVGLISYARRSAPTAENPARVEPFLVVQTQLWLRELRHLVCAVDATSVPRFSWADDGAPGGGDKEAGEFLPLAYCLDCGSAGMASVQREGEQQLQTELAAIGLSWLNRSRACRFVVPGHSPVPDLLPPEYLCPNCLRLQAGETCDTCQGEHGGVPTIPVRVSRDQSEQVPPRFLARCPDCGAERSLSMLGSRSASLLSVAISHLFQSDFNQDKKLLAFTDSVQDASHRAGFFGARTYRFNLRTAMQSAIEGVTEPLTLDRLADEMWEFWLKRKAKRDLIPTLLPNDLRELDTYRAFVDQEGEGTHKRLEADLLARLSWEAVMEFGLNSRVGRTLEGTLCATVNVDRTRLSPAAERLALELHENPLFEPPFVVPEGPVIEHFLDGLLRRLRLRGGIEHPFLTGYIREGGKWFLLSKRKRPLMSPFGSQSVLPRFLTDVQKVSGKDSVFDGFPSAAKPPYSWYRDWAARSLGVPIQDAGINDLYRKAIELLEQAGVLKAHALTKGARAWGLAADALQLSADPIELKCTVCRRALAVGQDTVPYWAGHRCPRYRCPGALQQAGDQNDTYYGRIYRSGRLQRIFTEEHTGLLTREKREEIEELFKKGTAPGAPNLFVCTPTLELGIDIGDLSAAALCSVPPTTANYLQRIGRTGRTTGNAFCLTVANSRPHDLYFHAQPLEMMAGQVLPPGCFLDAPEMLQRQIVAHGMDAWARQEKQLTRLPPQAGFVLGEAGRKKFPGRFLEFYRAHAPGLTASFLASFDEYLSPDNRARLEEFGLGESVPDLVNRAFDRLRDEIDALRSFQKRVRERSQQIEADPDSSVDPEVEKQELDETRRMLARLVTELRHKYVLNVLTDEGALPNYAFPEPGVRLESVVADKKSDGTTQYEPREYVRPASTAIRELAPFNTFYAEGRKVRIDEVDIGTKAKPLVESWRLCAECSYMEREMGAAQTSHCPRCRNGDWGDAGQVRKMVHFRRSRSLATRLESSTVDDTDDRESEHYQTLDLIDVGPQNRNGAKLIADLPFGIELLKDLTLREVNFGLDRKAGTLGFKVCGQHISEKGFVVCSECGRAQDPDGSIRHNAYCKGKKPDAPQTVETILLYREVESEAIRVLLPVSEIELDETRASFKAALQLGFRRHFQGDPGHLLIKAIREPIPGGYGIRQFLIIFDGVPGGTGYLSELWHGGNFLDVLAKALEVLQACPCQRDGTRDGCYRCLYAYQSQRDLKIVSSRRAQNLLKQILDRRDKWESVQTLSEVGLDDRLESELEAKFLAVLRERVQATGGGSWEERVQAGEVRYRARLGQVTWEIRSQVSLGRAQGVTPSTRPDFMMRCVAGGSEVKEIAIYCDGLAFHACPGEAVGRIGDDIVKRRAILDSGRYHVWSVTWKDVQAFEDKANSGPEDSLLRDLHGNRTGQIAGLLGLAMDWREARRGSMETLLTFMAKPDVLDWRRLAQVCGLDAIKRGHMRDDYAVVIEQQLLREPTRFDAGSVPVGGRSVQVMAHVDQSAWHIQLVSGASGDLAAGRLGRLRVVIRLFDDPAARSDEEFESSWRSVLEAWNLFQFLENTEVVSSECLSEFIDLESDTAHVAAEPKAQYGAKGAVSPALEELLAVATSASSPIVRAAFGAGLSLPQLDFELVPGGVGCGPQADVAWPEARVALLGAGQAVDRSVFEGAGWVVFEYPVEASIVIEALSGGRNG